MSATALSPTIPEELSLSQAASYRTPDGRYLFGSWKTLRRDIDRDLLDAEFRDGEWKTTRSALEALPEKKAAAKRGLDDPYAAVRRHIDRALAATPPLRSKTG